MALKDHPKLLLVGLAAGAVAVADICYNAALEPTLEERYAKIDFAHDFAPEPGVVCAVSGGIAYVTLNERCIRGTYRFLATSFDPMWVGMQVHLGIDNQGYVWVRPRDKPFWPQ